MERPRDLTILCTVRACGRPLSRAGQTWTCDAGHAFDVARSGYVNLLQPQDRRSAEPGDSRESVAARARLIEAGIGRELLDACVELIAGLPGPHGAIADLGCGTGELLAGLASRTGAQGVGIDLSIHAIERAVKQFPALTWLVANADRGLPLEAGSLDLVVSFHGRRNPPECRRVLKPSGHLIVAIPAPDDLIELRAAVEGSPVLRDRSEALLAEHREWFDLVLRRPLRERHHVERPALLDLLSGTYRGARHARADAVAGLGALDVTVASDVFVMAPKVEGPQAVEAAW